MIIFDLLIKNKINRNVIQSGSTSSRARFFYSSTIWHSWRVRVCAPHRLASGSVNGPTRTLASRPAIWWVPACVCLFSVCSVHSKVNSHRFFTSSSFINTCSVSLSLDFFWLGSQFVFVRMVVKSSSLWHSSMFNSIMHTRLHFFESTPIGRILNRFSKDLATIETNIPKSFNEFSSFAFQILTAFAVILIMKPIFLIVLAPIFAIFMMIQVRLKIKAYRSFNWLINLIKQLAILHGIVVETTPTRVREQVADVCAL